MPDKVAGIIGGLGPEATVDLMRRVIRATPAEDDADHIRMLVDSNPKAPSRIRALIEGTGESPGPFLAGMARNLELWGADFLAMPCNTAHYYLGEIREAVSVPVLNMIELTVGRAAKMQPGIGIVGMLASTAVHKTRLYEAAFQAVGAGIISPEPQCQEGVMACIRSIKTGRAGAAELDLLNRAVLDLMSRGAEALVVACTELSIVAETIFAGVTVYDSAQVLAEAIVKAAKGTC